MNLPRSFRRSLLANLVLSLGCFSIAEANLPVFACLAGLAAGGWWMASASPKRCRSSPKAAGSMQRFSKGSGSTRRPEVSPWTRVHAADCPPVGSKSISDGALRAASIEIV